jgi:hypothetical protein
MRGICSTSPGFSRELAAQLVRHVFRFSCKDLDGVRQHIDYGLQ